MRSLADLFSATGIPHGYCILWRPDILALHVISDSLIAAAYFSIPLAIFAFVRRRTDLLAEHRRVALLFCAFILGCGMTHVMGVVIFWYPLYGVDGLIKAATALLSVVTAVAVWPLLPRLLEIPSPRALTAANGRLEDEITARMAALEALQAIRASLESEVESRTREVSSLARRFEIATEGSVITVSEQDEALRYTWLHNPRAPFSRDIVGRSDHEALPASSSALLEPLKLRVLASGEALRTDVALEVGEDARHFDMRITPAVVGGQVRGILVAAIDVTERKLQQEHQNLVMSELAHRAKNLLALIDGIARQSARAEGLPSGFAQRFGARIAALAGAHDLLIENDWRGATIGELIQAQLAHLLPEAGDRVTISGPSVVLTPEASQYLALALHELATNATKYGVLGRAEGDLRIVWSAEQREQRQWVTLTWCESGASLSKPSRSGFGSRLLEQLVPRALGGEAALEFGPAGLTWRIAFRP